MQTQEALARAAGVAPSAVSRLRASDRVHTPLAAPQPKTHQILLQLDGDLPALVCTQEGRVDGETAKETNNRCNRNFTRRQAVLRAAGVAAAALATEVSDRVQRLACTNSPPPTALKTAATSTAAVILHRPSAASFALPTALMRAWMDAATSSVRAASQLGVTTTNSRPALRAAPRCARFETWRLRKFCGSSWGQRRLPQFAARPSCRSSVPSKKAPRQKLLQATPVSV